MRECSCISVHGANRLGGIPFWKRSFSGRSQEKCTNLCKFKCGPGDRNDREAVVEESNRISGLLGRKVGEEFFTLRDELKNILDEKVGIFRNELDLAIALDMIRELKKRYKNVYVRNKGAIFNQELVNVIELEECLMSQKRYVWGKSPQREPWFPFPP